MIYNPLINFLGVTDEYGTNVSNYRPIFKEFSLRDMNPIGPVIGFIVSLISIIIVTITTVLTFAVNMLTDPSMVLGPLTDLFEVVLGFIHAIVPPWVVAVLAFVLTVGWLMLSYIDLDGLFGENKNNANYLNRYGTRASSLTIKQALTIVLRGMVIALVVYVLAANPMKVLTGLVALVSGVATTIVGEGFGMDFQWVIGSLVQLISFGGFLTDDSLFATWSQSMETGNEAAFFTAWGVEPQHAGVNNLLLAIFALLVAVAMAYFLVKAFIQGSLFFVYAVIDFIVLPYRLAFMMLNPNTVNYAKDMDQNKKWFLELGRMFGNMFINLVYYLIFVFILTSGPALLFTIAAQFDMHGVLQLTVAAVVFWAAGTQLHKIRPRVTGDGRVYSWRGMRDSFLSRSDDGVLSFSETAKAKGVEVRNTLTKDATGKTWDERFGGMTMMDKVSDLAGGTRAYNSYLDSLSESERKAMMEAFDDNSLLNKRQKVEAWDDPDALIGVLESRREEVFEKAQQGLIASDVARKKIDGINALIGEVQAVKEKKAAFVAPETLVAVPSDLRGREEFEGKWFVSQAEIDAVRETMAKEDFERDTGGLLNADAMAVWDDVAAEFDKIKGLEEKLDSIRATGDRKAFDALDKEIKDRKELYNSVVVVKRLYEEHEGGLENIVKNPDYGKDGEEENITLGQMLQNKRLKEKKREKQQEDEMFFDLHGITSEQKTFFNNPDAALRKLEQDRVDLQFDIDNKLIGEDEIEQRRNVIDSNVKAAEVMKQYKESKTVPLWDELVKSPVSGDYVTVAEVRDELGVTVDGLESSAPRFDELSDKVKGRVRDIASMQYGVGVQDVLDAAVAVDDFDRFMVLRDALHDEIASLKQVDEFSDSEADVVAAKAGVAVRKALLQDVNARIFKAQEAVGLYESLGEDVFDKIVQVEAPVVDEKNKRMKVEVSEVKVPVFVDAEDVSTVVSYASEKAINDARVFAVREFKPLRDTVDAMVGASVGSSAVAARNVVGATAAVAERRGEVVDVSRFEKDIDTLAAFDRLKNLNDEQMGQFKVLKKKYDDMASALASDVVVLQQNMVDQMVADAVSSSAGVSARLGGGVVSPGFVSSVGLPAGLVGGSSGVVEDVFTVAGRVGLGDVFRPVVVAKDAVGVVTEGEVVAETMYGAGEDVRLARGQLVSGKRAVDGGAYGFGSRVVSRDPVLGSDAFVLQVADEASARDALGDSLVNETYVVEQDNVEVGDGAVRVVVGADGEQSVVRRNKGMNL